MNRKERKAIKKIKRRLNALMVRVDELSETLEQLMTGIDVFDEEAGREAQNASEPGAHFNQGQVEDADELTDEAEEFADIKEKIAEEKKTRKKKKK